MSEYGSRSNRTTAWNACWSTTSAGRRASRLSRNRSEISPINLFSFLWGRDAEPEPGNSTLVEFRLFPDWDGTRPESGFSTLDDAPEGRVRYRDGNVEGWAHEVGKLVAYIATVDA